MRHPPRHHPGPRSRHIEKLHILFPPRLIFFLQRGQPFAAVLGVPFHKFHPRLLLGQRRRADINPQHVAEPQVFAHALMHHLLTHAATPRITLARPHDKILVLKLAPHTHHLHPLGGIRLDQKCVSHSRKCYPNPPNHNHVPPPPTPPRSHRHRRHLHRLCLDRPWPTENVEGLLHSSRSFTSHRRSPPQNQSPR